jgi:hypothetical protein
MKQLRAGLTAIALGLGAASACTPHAPYFATNPGERAADSLRPVESSGFWKGWARAGVSFDDYDAVWLLYRGLSYRDKPRSSRAALGNTNYALPEDLEAVLLAGLEEIFAEELTQTGSLRFANAKGSSVMAAVISLVDVTVHAPLSTLGGDDLTWVQKVADVTVVIELFDSQSATVLARFTERRPVVPVSMRPMRATPGATKYEMRSVFRVWAQALRSFIDAWRTAPTLGATAPHS